ncbi:MAG: HAMP domain-containing sensor histidine kinase [Pseudomonadota bacterium]
MVAHSGLRIAHDAFKPAAFGALDEVRSLVHEMGNALTLLRQSLEMVEETGQRHTELRATAERSARDMAKLLDGFCAAPVRTPSLSTSWHSAPASRRAVLDLAPHSVAKLLTRALDDYRPSFHDKGVQLVAPPRCTGLVAYTDDERLNRALSNLLSNALKYTPSDGMVMLAAQGREDRVEITVRDTGIGIRQADQAHLFEPGYRSGESSAPGMGRGLAIVRALMDQLGGEVSVQSNGLGEGTEATLRIAKARLHLPPAPSFNAPLTERV